MAVTRHADGSLEFECKHCGISMTRKPPIDSTKEIVIRLDKMELGMRVIQGEQLDFARRLQEVASRVEKLEGGKVE